MYQKIVLIGNLGKDPEARVVPSGVSVCNFSVAANRQYKNASGEVIKETTWFRITAWGQLADVCAKYLRSGRLVMVEGRMSAPKPYVSQTTGQPACSLEVTADVVKFLSPAGHNGGSEETSDTEQTAPVPTEETIPF
jgi:single-strand DNA-binding protein